MAFGAKGKQEVIISGTVEDKTKQYEDMVNSPKTEIDYITKGGKRMRWVGCWDLRTTMKERSFKTQYNPAQRQSIKEIKGVWTDLTPVFKGYWTITIKR